MVRNKQMRQLEMEKGKNRNGEKRANETAGNGEREKQMVRNGQMT